MEVIVRKNAEEASKLGARMIGDAVRAKPDTVLGLATGRTMERLYALLGAMHETDGLDFSRSKSFNLDEYIGLAPENKNSYRAYMNRHLFSKINIKAENTHLPDGMCADPEEAARDYEEQIRQCGGVDIQLAGIGRTGHIGFNEPLSPLFSRTRMVPLTRTTYEQNSPLFANPEEMPRFAMTMGVGTVLDAKQVILLATGAEKAEIIHRAVEGALTSMISASALQMHNNAVVILDEEAASKLENREYYDWVFAQTPRYAKYRD